MRFREIMDGEIKLITLDFTLPASVNIISSKQHERHLHNSLLCPTYAI